MMKLIMITTILASFLISSSALCSVDDFFAEKHNIENIGDGKYKVTGENAHFVFNPFNPPITILHSLLGIEFLSEEPFNANLSWFRHKETPVSLKNFPFSIEKTNEPQVMVADFELAGDYDSSDLIRLFIHKETGFEFDIKSINLISIDEVSNDIKEKMIDFRCFTSKLHFKEEEQIEYKAVLKAKYFPDKESAKVVRFELLDEDGNIIESTNQHFGVHPFVSYKEVYGVFNSKPKSGKYIIQAEIEDLRTKYKASNEHQFAVTDKNDPLVYETPFKFVKDFSVIRGDDNLFHIFSITGEFFNTHEWFDNGQERTFSHGTSKDLKNWTYHEPVMSIDDTPYPDGNGKFKNRNIWAPHVIKHNDLYYMYYTSVNDYTSQSISLATSIDLFNWEDYEKNPVLTFENVEWASWGRNAGYAGRDPMVLSDNGKFYMYVTADAKEGEQRGVVAVAESDDLYNWKNPQIAVRGNIALESPQVWKSGDTYYMLTSSHGYGSYTSKDPVVGWTKDDFPRPPLPDIDKKIKTSGSYAEEVIQLEDGSFIMASITFRHWGNSIYFFKIILDENGRPIGYESPFEISD